MSGWISLHRKIRRHWIFEDANYLKAWIVILFEVNRKDKKVLSGKNLIECKCGESLNSLATWVKLFGKKWTIQKVRTFFKLLQKEQMINIQGLKQTTRLSVVNYESYQDKQQADNILVTDKQQADNILVTTNNNYNNYNKKTVKKINYVPAHEGLENSANCEQVVNNSITSVVVSISDQFLREKRFSEKVIEEAKSRILKNLPSSIANPFKFFEAYCINVAKDLTTDSFLDEVKGLNNLELIKWCKKKFNLSKLHVGHVESELRGNSYYYKMPKDKLIKAIRGMAERYQFQVEIKRERVIESQGVGSVLVGNIGC